MKQRRLWLQGTNYKRASLLLGLLVIAVDQLSKFWVRESLAPYASTPQEGFLRISHMVNPGLVFGLSAPTAVSVILPILAVAVSLFLYWRYAPMNSRLLGVAAGLFIGGCLGTLVDRTLFGGVTDIIDVNISESFGRVVFNVADLCCIAGIVVFDIFLIRLRRVTVPKEQYLIPYLWRNLVEAERSRPQTSQWWKPASARPRTTEAALDRSSERKSVTS